MAVERDPLMDLPILSIATPTSKGTPAQDWAYYLNEIFTIFDAHNHNFGSGKKVDSANLVADDFDLSNFSIINVEYITFTTPFDILNCSFYTSGADVDLYYQDGDGVAIRFTQGGVLAVAASLVGGFTGDYTTDNAMALFAGEKNLFSFYGASGADNAKITCSSVNISNTLTVSSGSFTGVINGTAPAYFSGLKLTAPVSNGTTLTNQFVACDSQPIQSLPANAPQIWRRNSQGGITFPNGTFVPDNNVTQLSGEKYWIQNKDNVFVKNISKTYELFYECIRDVNNFKIQQNTPIGVITHPYITILNSKLILLKPMFYLGSYDNPVDFNSTMDFINIKMSIVLLEGAIKITYDATNVFFVSNALFFELQILWMLPLEEIV